MTTRNFDQTRSVASASPRANGKIRSAPALTQVRRIAKNNGTAAIARTHPDRLKPETIAAQAGGAVDAATGAIVPPIHVATTFVRDADNQYRRGYCYGRSDNATIRQTEHVLAQLEEGAATLLFASGMAAATTAFLALERPAHIVAPKAMYWGLRQWLTEDASSHGVETTFVDAGDHSALRAAIRPGRTRLIWIETPSNPLWTITDISEAARIAHGAGALLAVEFHGADAGPHPAADAWRRHGAAFGDQVPQRPLRRRRRRHRIRPDWCRPSKAPRACGPCLAPSSARSRQRCCSGACAPCTFASATNRRRPWPSRAISQSHPAIELVLYPGLDTHPGHAIAARQMQGGFGGMLSMRVKGGETAAIAAAGHMKVWKRATSLGGVESLVEHRSSIEGAGSPCPTDLLRFSVGLENIEDLIADIERSLAASRARYRKHSRPTSRRTNILL